MLTALLDDKADFVRLFLESGLSMREFLTVERLGVLYRSVSGIKHCKDFIIIVVIILIINRSCTDIRPTSLIRNILQQVANNGVLGCLVRSEMVRFYFVLYFVKNKRI
jgi:hypothetical protein